LSGHTNDLERELLDHAPQGVLVLELPEGGGEHGVVLRYANAKASALLGVDCSLALGMPGLAGLPHALGAWLRSFAPSCVTRARTRSEHARSWPAVRAAERLTVTVVPVQARAVALHLEAALGPRRGREDHTQLASFLDSIIEHIPAMVFVKDAEHLRFERFNRAGEELLGVSRQELLGKTDYDLFPKEQADFFVAKDRKVLEERRLVDIPDEPIETPHGTRHLHTRKIPLLDEHGEPQHLLGISIDITEQRRAEEVLRSAHEGLEREIAQRTAELRREITERERAEQALAHTEEALRHAQKMEAIGRLAGGVAHDFNNLLSVVISYSDLLLLRLSADDRMRNEVEEIRKAGQRAAQLTRQLLAFSRQQVLQPKVLSLNEVLANMETMLSRVLGEDIALGLRSATALPKVKADPSQIEQVVMNLVVNARDAMPTGGQLWIETASFPVLPPDVASERLGPHVAITVSDTGVGMDGETRGRIFEPFFTTKERGKGTGLGLSTVFGIVKQSGGTIRVRSELGRGASFDVFLPVTDEVELGATSAALGDQSDLNGDETVLLVEDEAPVRVLAASILRKYGYEVIEAGRPSEAIAAAASHRGEIHLLLTDVVMPEMGGRLLAEQLAGQRPHMRVIFMSGYTDDAVVRHGVLESTMELIQKPFSSDELARRVRKALG
jgi:PAS domain S-box-containing protein